MRLQANDREVSELIKELAEHVDQLQHGIRLDQKNTRGLSAVELVRRARQPMSDGYPTNLRGEGHAGSGTVSDPTGDTAITQEHTDVVRNAAQSLILLLKGARGDIRAAVGQLRAASPPALHDDPEQNWCTNHLIAGMFEPRATHSVTGKTSGELCRWCRDFKGMHNFLPDRVLMADRQDKGKVSPSDTQAALARMDRAG